MRTVNPALHASRRAAIMVAARKCFARNGFHQSSIADIRTVAGISSGTLFHYFPNKQALVLAIVASEGEQVALCLSQLAEIADCRDALNLLLQLIAELAADGDANALAIEIAAESRRDPDVRALAADNDTVLREGLEGLIRAGIARGQVSNTVDAALVAQWLMSWIDGVFSRVSVDLAFKPMDQLPLMRQLLDMVLTGGRVMS
ncbi:TetR/AcrR family transcriptional regulator [Niveispirillum sp. SYP-B3756]|uniref:TetR/AcrR family transcriptional regulator n=1 Tax=Niveispirillum sp. SYP-B3756 TaxID=2662178 RepID=UPI001567B279|nr:TetR/AcrR family transcriptional regulator [Niveispirillum sp. SYP-B3756]